MAVCTSRYSISCFNTIYHGRQYDFMITGLRETEHDLRAKHIPFHLTMGDPGT